MFTIRRYVKPEKKLWARKLRKNQTVCERIVWEKIKGKRTGYKFRRQAIILGYIADFYCPSKRLVIEIDGSSHDEKQEYDAHRDKVMGEVGIKVLRFKNEDVLYRLVNIMDILYLALNKQWF